jgi:acetyl-CoA carboxylase biotin carboxyl carrier protein
MKPKLLRSGYHALPLLRPLPLPRLSLLRLLPPPRLLPLPSLWQNLPANPADHPGAVKSPMVGTVYTAPEPDAPAFITEGATVTAGQTLFIVEAMKVMNPITAPKAGTVVKIFVQNAQPIEFGEALVIVE